MMDLVFNASLIIGIIALWIYIAILSRQIRKDWEREFQDHESSSHGDV